MSTLRGFSHVSPKWGQHNRLLRRCRKPNISAILDGLKWRWHHRKVLDHSELPEGHKKPGSARYSAAYFQGGPMVCKYASLLDEVDAETIELIDSAPSVAGKHRILKGSGYTVGLTTAKEHHAGTCACSETPVAAGESEAHNGDSSSYVRFSEQPWGSDDYRAFIKAKGQDPDEVTFTWGWTSNPGGGFWNKLNNVRPKPKTETLDLDLPNLIDHVRSWKAPSKPVSHSGSPVSLVVGMADFQLGKGEGDGTAGTLRRLAASLESIVEHVGKLRAEGYDLERIVLANMGDHTEGVSGSYSSQTHTTDLNVRDQIKLALEVNMQWIKTLAPLAPYATYSACLCNHGQLSRNGGKDNITDDADNGTGLIGDTLKTVCDLHPDLDRIDWFVPRDEMITTFEASGVSVATSHGHKISGKEEDWLAKQSQYLTQARRFIPDIWFTAHRHHADLKDYGPYTRVQATTSDPGSKYFLDQSGMYSRPGVTTFLVGKHLPGHWDQYRIH